MAPTESMNFTESDHSSALLEKLRSQREEGRFCDVTLHVEGKTFHAHRSVLASCSPYFDSILKMHRVVKERLTVTCQNWQGFQCLINYMYTGNVIIDSNNVSEILKLANHFLVSKLKAHCEQYLSNSLQISNYLSVRELADKYNMPQLIERITQLIRQNYQHLATQDEFLKLSFQQFQDLLNDKSFEWNSENILTLSCGWITAELSTRESHFDTLIEMVEWNTLNDQEICTHLDSQVLYATSSNCLLLVLRILAQAARLPMQYQGTFQALTCEILVNTPLLPLAVSDLTSTINTMDIQTNSTENLDSTLNNNLGVDTNKSTDSIERPKHRRKPNTVAHLWRTPAARLSALKRMQDRMQNMDNNDTNDHNEEEGLEMEGIRYKCSICGYTCALSKDYYTHMKQLHFPGPPFTCDSCEYTCERLHMVLSHRIKHSEEKPFTCNECGFKCRTRPNLIQHQKIHSGQRPFTCEACGRSFAMKSTLEQHLATHSSDRPYLCDTCGFSTKYLSHLVAHKRIHTGEVFRCSYPHCRYSTPKKSQLDSHIRTHMGVRPHTCSTCGRGFLEKSHLVRHERIHLDEKPFKCAQCDYASSRRDKLKEHFSRHHGQNASAKVPYRPRPPRRGKFDDVTDLLLPQITGAAPPTPLNTIVHQPSIAPPPQAPQIPTPIQPQQYFDLQQAQPTTDEMMLRHNMFVAQNYHHHHHPPPHPHQQPPPPQQNNEQRTNTMHDWQACMPLF